MPVIFLLCYILLPLKQAYFALNVTFVPKIGAVYLFLFCSSSYLHYLCMRKF